MSTDICRFGLIVTGRGEAKFLHLLFRAIMGRAHCTFCVIRRIGQRNPITAPHRLLRMAGTAKRLPTKDEEEIGLPALAYLRQYSRSAVLLIDDLEADRRTHAADVFRRYRNALDAVLATTEVRQRASVHFLVNMIEAYYFAHSAAVNRVAGMTVLLDDHTADVEDIPHPKRQLRAVWPSFDEVEHGERIVRQLDLDHILSRPAECRWLRALFAWCIDKVVEWDAVHDSGLRNAFCVDHGEKAALTYPQ